MNIRSTGDIDCIALGKNFSSLIFTVKEKPLGGNLGFTCWTMTRTIDGILRTLNKMRKLQVLQVLVRPLILLDLLREYSCFLVFSDDKIRDGM